MRTTTSLLLLLVLMAPAQAFEGRYRVQGMGPEGSYDGSAQVKMPRSQLPLSRTRCSTRRPRITAHSVAADLAGHRRRWVRREAAMRTPHNR